MPEAKPNVDISLDNFKLRMLQKPLIFIFLIICKDILTNMRIRFVENNSIFPVVTFYSHSITFISFTIKHISHIVIHDNAFLKSLKSTDAN